MSCGVRHAQDHTIESVTLLCSAAGSVKLVTLVTPGAKRKEHVEKWSTNHPALNERSRAPVALVEFGTEEARTLSSLLEPLWSRCRL